MKAKLLGQVRDQWMGALALFLVLTGGTAWAVDGSLAGQNTVGSLDIINGEVTADDLAANSVGSAKVTDRSVKNADLSIGASNSNTIADGGIQGIDVKNNTLTAAQIDESNLSLALLDSPLPSGETLTGIWGVTAPGTPTAPGRGNAPIAFRPQLAADLPLGSGHYMTPGSTSAQCPGVGLAAAGQLCVYEGFSFGATFWDFANPADGGSGDSVPKEGTILRMAGTDPLGQARGTWAVTAP